MKTGLLLLKLSFVSLLAGCELLNYDQTRTHLAADYSVVTNYEGYSSLHFQKHFWAEDVSLTQLDAAAVAGNYLVICIDASEGIKGYYFLPLYPESKEVIEKSTIGPLSRVDYRLKLVELVGDSTLQLSSVH